MEKTPAVAYVTYKIRTTDRVELLQELEHAPITYMDHDFIVDIISGMSYKQLADKYNKSSARIYQWKRTLFEKLHQYDMRKVMR